MSVIDKVFAAGETALILRQALGNIRSWDDALADMRSGKTNVHGYVLEPVGKVYHERAKRPVYAGKQIMGFILNVRSATAKAIFKQPAQGMLVEYDEAKDWRLQMIDTSGSCAI